MCELFAFWDSGFEAAGEVVGEVGEELAVHRLAGGEVGANRVQHGGFDVAVCRQFGDDFSPGIAVR